ncbi:hypothetical protein LXL04_007759 [Taraxacum kok-saghyz]
MISNSSPVIPSGSRIVYCSASGGSLIFFTGRNFADGSIVSGGSVAGAAVFGGSTSVGFWFWERNSCQAVLAPVYAGHVLGMVEVSLDFHRLVVLGGQGGVARVISFRSPSPDLQSGRRRFIMAYNDWEWRIGNKKEQKKQRLEQNRVSNKAWRVIDDITTKFYVTNFPPGTYPNDLRTLCEKFGRVVDVYIHPKLSKYGKKFAFLPRFCVGGSFWTKGGFKEDTVRRGIANNRASQNTAHKEKEQVRNVPRGSYAEAVREGEGISVKEVKAKGQSRSIELPMNCILSIMEQLLHRLVALNDPTVIKKFPKICCEEGFEIGVRYVGGRWVLVSFPSSVAVEGFKKSVAIMRLVKEIREIVDNFVVEERLIWVDVRGLPACAWNDKAIRHIVERWGELMFYEDDVYYPLASRRVDDDSVDDDGGSEGMSERESESEDQNYDDEQEVEEGELHRSPANDNSFGEYNNSDIRTEGPYECGVTERKKKHKKRRQWRLDGSHGSGKPHLVMESSSRTFNPKSTSNEVFQKEEIGRFMELGKILGIHVGSEEEVHKRLETRMTKVDLFKVRDVWGNQNFDFAVSSARVIVYGCWVRMDLHVFMVNVYTPQGVVEKRRLWNSIMAFMERNPGNYMFLGDFNAVRNADERAGSVLCHLSTNDFNEFISNAGLVEVAMTGRRFTRVSSNGLKMARLDRFLVSEEISERFPNLSGLLKIESVNYGPSSFRFFYSWLLHPEFDRVVRSAWGDSTVVKEKKDGNKVELSLRLLELDDLLD